MVNLGLTDFDPRHVIIAINLYDLDHAGQYPGLLGGALRQFRVWVTESGIRDPDLHMSWIRDNYPRIRNLVRAGTVVLVHHVGRGHRPRPGFSLIRNPGSFPNYSRSPLFELLAGRL